MSETPKTKTLELTLVERDSTRAFAVKSINKCEADDLVQLLSQFMIIIAMVQNNWLKEERLRTGNYDSDDIPF